MLSLRDRPKNVRKSIKRFQELGPSEKRQNEHNEHHKEQPDRQNTRPTKLDSVYVKNCQ